MEQNLTLNNISAEEQMRFAIFRKNAKKIPKLREKERGSATYGFTEFADLTGE